MLYSIRMTDLRLDPSKDVSINELARYYDGKTQRLLDKYGPGPRIHYHTGISDGSHVPGISKKELSALMFEAQERILDHLVSPIAKLRSLEGGPPRVLDVGCGLGGASLYLAEKYDAYVTSITIAAEHVPIVRRFASQMGLINKMEILEQDAHTMPGHDRFDAAIAIESSCYFDRFAWFRRMADLLRPGGQLSLLDWMRGKSDESSSRVDAYWHTRMAFPAEYREAARSAGLRVDEEELLNDKTAGFWVLARDWNEAALRERKLGAAEVERLERSSREIANLEASFRSGSVLCARMLIRKPSASEELGQRQSKT